MSGNSAQSQDAENNLTPSKKKKKSIAVLQTTHRAIFKWVINTVIIINGEKLWWTRCLLTADTINTEAAEPSVYLLELLIKIKSNIAYDCWKSSLYPTFPLSLHQKYY